MTKPKASVRRSRKKRPTRLHQKAKAHVLRHISKYFAVLALAVIGGTGYTVVVAHADSTPPGGFHGAPLTVSGPTRDRIIAIATKQIGRGEQGINCQQYSPKGACRAWCADFVNWVWHAAGVAHTRSHLKTGNGYEIASIANAYGKIQKLYTTDHRVRYLRPKPGDAILFSKSTYKANEHIGIVTAVRNSNDIDLIEGNAGSSDTKVISHKNYHPYTCGQKKNCGDVYSYPFAYLQPMRD